MLLPGASLGILGGGQLGRMTAMVARRMGYRVVVFDPAGNCPAAQLATEHVCAPFTDAEALARFAASVDAVTIEFENLPAEALEYLAAKVPVRPSAPVLRVCQNRLLERRFLSSLGIPTSPFSPVSSVDELAHALKRVGTPALLKTAVLGYDSKGQKVVSSPRGGEEAFKALGEVPCILERQIDFHTEISVIVARDEAGTCEVYPAAENTHWHGILDLSVTPAGVSEEVLVTARILAERVAAAFELCGVLAVEFFVLPDGRLLVNELAPRPHNSGHWSIEACGTSQFEQQARVVLGMPVGKAALISPAATANLLGDLWQFGEPRWEQVLTRRDVKLHLYGKAEARPGRKMGHLTALAASAEQAGALVLEARKALATDQSA